MTKILDAYTAIPVSDEGSAEKAVIPIAIALVAGALAVTGFNAVKGNVADTMSDNMGKDIHEQVTGERSSAFASDLEKGKVELPVQLYDLDSHKQDK